MWYNAVPPAGPHCTTLYHIVPQSKAAPHYQPTHRHRHRRRHRHRGRHRHRHRHRRRYAAPVSGAGRWDRQAVRARARSARGARAERARSARGARAERALRRAKKKKAAARLPAKGRVVIILFLGGPALSPPADGVVAARLLRTVSYRSALLWVVSCSPRTLWTVCHPSALLWITPSPLGVPVVQPPLSRRAGTPASVGPDGRLRVWDLTDARHSSPRRQGDTRVPTSCLQLRAGTWSSGLARFRARRVAPSGVLAVPSHGGCLYRSAGAPRILKIDKVHAAV